MSKKKDYDDFHRPDPERNNYGKGPKGYRRSDEKIYDEVCERLTTSYEVDASDISVEVSDGIVRLEGSIESRRAKRLAEDIVLDVNGVIDVRNSLSIQSQEHPQASQTPSRLRSPDESTDSELGHRH